VPSQPEIEQADQRPDTRTRLLDAAGETFAELGFKSTTVREICRRAGANIAAVNYHFGGKEELYAAVLTYTAQTSMERYPLGEATDPNTPAPRRLEAFVRNYLERLLDEGRPAWFGKLVAREMFEPTGALDKVAQTFAKPQFARLRETVAELLGPAATEPTLTHCCFSVIGQCLCYKHARPMIERLAPQQGFGPADRAALTKHISAFSLAAFQRLRDAAACGGGA
jgi:TetR/AcrR family transcriptional regulator, regulator of cefoperazone and chloramphenicol sensitivity